MSVTLEFVSPSDWKILFPLLERLKIAFKIEKPAKAEPVNDLQEFLLSGPVASEEDLLQIEEKRKHFEAWN